MRNENYIEVKAQMFHFDVWVLETNPIKLKSTFEKLLIDSGFNIINFTEHFFPVKGYTCIWLLGESHLAIHTFPESKKSYIQISSCNEEKLNSLKKMIKH